MPNAHPDKLCPSQIKAAYQERKASARCPVAAANFRAWMKTGAHHVLGLTECWVAAGPKTHLPATGEHSYT